MSEKYKVVTEDGKTLEKNASKSDAFKAAETYTALTGKSAQVKKQ